MDSKHQTGNRLLLAGNSYSFYRVVKGFVVIHYWSQILLSWSVIASKLGL